MSRRPGVALRSFAIALTVGLLVVGPQIRRPGEWVASHLLFSYRDGLMRRALVGSLLESVAPERVVSIELATAIGTLALLLFVIVAATLASVTAARTRELIPVMLAAGLLLASAHTRMLASDVARFDVILITLTMLISLAVLHSVRLGSATFLALVPIALLVHENAAIVVLPLAGTMLVVRRSIDRMQATDHRSDRWFLSAAIIGAAAATTVALTLPTVPNGTVEAAMERASQRSRFLIPPSAFRIHTDGIRDNLEIMISFWRGDAFPAAVVLLLAALPAAVVAWGSLRATALVPVRVVGMRSERRVDAGSLILCTAGAPLLLMFIGVDYGRWTTMTVMNMAIAALWSMSVLPRPATESGEGSPPAATRVSHPRVQPLTLLAFILALTLPAPTNGRAEGLGFASDPLAPFAIVVEQFRAVFMGS